MDMKHKNLKNELKLGKNVMVEEFEQWWNSCPGRAAMSANSPLKALALQAWEACATAYNKAVFNAMKVIE